MQAVAVRRWTGNDVSGHYFPHYNYYYYFSFFSALSQIFLIDSVLGSKNLFNLGLDLFPDPVGHFEFCSGCGVAGGKRVPLALLGLY